MRPADWTRLIDWVVEFRALHEEARTGKLDRQRREKYDQESESLVRALLVAQRLSVKPGQTARQSLRVARELPVELTLGGQAQKVKTIDLGLGGFAAMLGKPPRVDERVEFALTLQNGDAVRGRVRVVNVQRKGKPYRVAFAFEQLQGEDARGVSFEIIDAALETIPPHSS